MRSKLWRLEVVWRDSHLTGGSWQPPKAYLGKTRCPKMISVGFVLADDEKGVVLASSIDLSGNAAGVVAIPASAVVSRRRLR